MMRALPFAAALLLAATALPSLPAAAKTFRMATTSDAATLDPHANNAFSTYLITGQIYESLIRRGPDLKLEPELALRWEQVDPTRWRFWLRGGVKFQNGNVFDADDVVFSIGRSLAPTSNFGIYVDTVDRAERVEPLVVDIITRVPDAVIPDKLTRVLMMDREWTEANNSARPQNLREREELFAARNANGTGPFVLARREVDVRTVLTRNAGWWGGAPGADAVTEYHHVIIASDATRIAALLSNEIDMVHTVPSQDVARLQREPRIKMLIGQENRTVWIGFDQQRDELQYSNIKGRNPFKDRRVRQAVALAIDVEAIRTRTLRGQAVPTSSMWTQFVTGYDERFAGYPRPDLDRAKALLAEAGYPQGFEVQFDCPVGAYDEACQAVTAMLARIGITVRLNIQPGAQFFPRIQRQDLSMFALSWGVPTFDAQYTLRGIMMTKAKVGAASWNGGGYSNAQVDALIEEVMAETDVNKRIALIHQAQRVHNEDFGHIPLYHIMIPWAMRQGVDLAHRADNLVFMRDVTVK
jgi:peptide/nickel transport system substrate-binding protein